ncbi:unnamed protein product, partial [Iphiclides podalirius]
MKLEAQSKSPELSYAWKDMSTHSPTKERGIRFLHSQRNACRGRSHDALLVCLRIAVAHASTLVSGPTRPRADAILYEHSEPRSSAIRGKRNSRLKHR